MFQFNELKQLQDNLQALQEENENIIKALTKDIASRLLAKTIKRTPHITGHLVNGWTASEIKKNGSNYTIVISNPVYYSEYVEYGHRSPDHKKWINGRFMLTLSENEIKKDLNGIIEKKLKQLFKKV